jgi:hypothetical protein
MGYYFNMKKEKKMFLLAVVMFVCIIFMTGVDIGNYIGIRHGVGLTLKAFFSPH